MDSCRAASFLSYSSRAAEGCEVLQGAADFLLMKGNTGAPTRTGIMPRKKVKPSGVRSPGGLIGLEVV
jgi:hypothetical protein